MPFSNEHFAGDDFAPKHMLHGVGIFVIDTGQRYLDAVCVVKDYAIVILD